MQIVYPDKNWTTHSHITSAAVYCTGKDHCNKLMLPNDISGVCEEEGIAYQMPVVSELGEFKKSFYECSYIQTINLWAWQQKKCDGNNELFDGDACMQSCSKKDSRGIQWEVPYLEIGIKSCYSNQGGNNGIEFCYITH